MKARSISLRTRILLVTSVALTVVFIATAARVERQVMTAMSRSLETEARTSLQAYESLWNSNAELLAAVSLALSGMSDVRAAFGTRDRATIHDLAGERWARISRPGTVFAVTDPGGTVLASFGAPVLVPENGEIAEVRAAALRFPRQISGFLQQRGQLFQVVFTPVYVQSVRGPALLDVLVAGYPIDAVTMQHLRDVSGGSDFLFVSGGRIIASSLPPDESETLLHNLVADHGNTGAVVRRVSTGRGEYALLRRSLPDTEGRPIGHLYILRSFAAARRSMADLRRDLTGLWLLALGGGLALTYLLARRIMRPIARLDRAVAEVARQNYSHRIPVDGSDELGRLAATFNEMSASIERGREELVRQERLSTIGKLSSSLVHDLRNPLAAIYAGSEILMDGNLPVPQTRRLASNIHRASRKIQGMLQELVQASRRKDLSADVCSLSELIDAAWEEVAPAAQTLGVRLRTDVPPDLQLHLQRPRIERVFVNLMTNALEAMPDGGELRISCDQNGDGVLVDVRDTGPGVPESLRTTLFDPFATHGKKNGLGLGLALSRQTLRDHGGDLWLASDGGPGAHFTLRFPVAAETAAAHPQSETTRK